MKGWLNKASSKYLGNATVPDILIISGRAHSKSDMTLEYNAADIRNDVSSTRD
jgi:hypothetical protein